MGRKHNALKRKHLALVLGSILVMNVYGSTAFAATAGDYADLPASHWAYKAVTQLAKDGIIEGYSDKTLNSNKTMTRYEMAEIVKNAIENSNKATAIQKTLIDKLGMEFALELNKIDTRDIGATNLDKRVERLEKANKETMKVGFDATISYNTDSAPAGKAEARGPEKLISRYRLHMSADLNETTSYWMRVGTNFVMAGGNQASTAQAAPNTYTYCDLAYFTFKKSLGMDSIVLGRQAISELGGFLVRKGSGNDGITVEKRLNDSTTLRAGASYIKANNYNSTYGAIPDNVGDDQTFNFISWNKTFGKDSGVKALYGSAQDSQTARPSNGTVGYTGSRLAGVSAYTKMGNWTMTGEYVKAKLDEATDSANPHGWSFQITNSKAPTKYASTNFLLFPFVNLNKVGDNAFTISYHYLGAGASPNGFGSWNNNLGYSSSYNAQIKDNVKGWGIDYQHVLTKGVMLDLTYQRLEAANTIGAVKAGDKKLNSFNVSLLSYF